MLFYGIFRFGLEYIREPDAQLSHFAEVTHLHMGQWLCIPMILGGLYLMATANARRQRVEPIAGIASVMLIPATGLFDMADVLGLK